MSGLDPRLTFDTFVVGPANRLAAAAARRAAESPGTSYNPLFLYANSGLGKSHLLHAVAHNAVRAFSGGSVLYTTMEDYLAELARSLEVGEQEELRERYREVDFLLLDDVQFLTGQPQAQEMLLRTLDALTGAGKQVVLASDRPPAEINGLDERLVSRFSGGLIVDIGTPEYETRVAIVLRKAKERGVELAPEVPETVARIPFRNVRELQGALNRVLAIQELEGREVTAAEVRALLRVEERPSETHAPPPAPPPPEEPGSAWWGRVLAAAAAAESEGFSAARLRRIAESGREPGDLEALLRAFEEDLDRLRALRAEADALGEEWGGPGPSPLLDPERLEEAQAWLASARERTRPFPSIPLGPDLSDLGNRYPPLALRAADRMVSEERTDYNPLFIVCREPARGRGLLEGMARSLLFRRPRARVGLVSASAFAEEFIGTLSRGTSGAWRERWGSVDLLLVDQIQDLARTERVQEEFFHIFEALKRRGARVAVAADRSPEEIRGIEDRLRSRFEGGLVVEVDTLAEFPAVAPEVPRRPDRLSQGHAPDDAAVLLDLAELDIRDDGRGGLFPEALPREEPHPSPPAGGGQPPGVPRLGARGAGAAATAMAGRGVEREGLLTRPPQVSGMGAPVAGTGFHARPGRSGTQGQERWFPSGEKVVWEWPRLDERLVEDID